MTDLSELLERVKAATGPDRDLDAAIGKALGAEFKARNVHRRGHYIGGKPVLLRVAEDYPRFTASVDATLALVERCLPGWRYDIHSPRFGTPFEGVLMDGDSASRRIVVGHAPTAPLAILSALLQAIGEQP